MPDKLERALSAAYLRYGIYERWQVKIVVRCVVDTSKLTLVLVSTCHVACAVRQTPFRGESPIFAGQKRLETEIYEYGRGYAEGR